MKTDVNKMPNKTANAVISQQLADLRRVNLLRWMEQRDLSQSDMSRRLGLGRSYVSLVLTSGRPFGEKSARSIEAKLDMDPGYLDEPTGGCQIEIQKTWNTPDDVPHSAFALVPRVAVQLAAGGGQIPSGEEQLPPLAFRRDWLAKKAISARGALRVATVRGDSMADYILDGDSILVDTGQRDIVDMEVYAIENGGELRVKRLSRRPDGGLRIISDNKRFPEESLATGELDLVNIIGRVVWRAG